MTQNTWHELLNLIQNQNIGTLIPLSNIKSCEWAAINLEVIDFDNVKNEFQRQLITNKYTVKQTPTSADALFYDAKRDSLVFIELKDFNPILPNNAKRIEQEDRLHFELHRKLTIQTQMATFVDSISILFQLCAFYRNIDLLNELYKSKFHFIVLANIPPSDFESSGLGNLFQSAQQKFKIGFIKPEIITVLTSDTIKQYFQQPRNLIS